jgi:stage III sporulation protein AD
LLDILQISGLVIIAIVLTAVLKTQSSVVAPYVSQICAIVIIITAITSLTPLVGFLSSISDGTSYKNSYLKVVLTASAIAVISNTISDICKENGHAMLKNAVELAGNVEITALSLPLIKEIIDKAGAILRL